MEKNASESGDFWAGCGRLWIYQQNVNLSTYMGNCYNTFKCIHSCWMIHTLWLYLEIVDWSTDFGSNHGLWIDQRLWIDPQIVDWCTYCELIHRLRIDPKIVNWSTYCGFLNDPYIVVISRDFGLITDYGLINSFHGLIQRFWIDPEILDWSMDCGMILILLIDPQLVDWSTPCGLIHSL